MKANKSGVIACFVFAALFAVGGVVLMLLPAVGEDGLSLFAVGVMLLVLAAVFALSALVAFAGLKKQQKRYQFISERLAQMNCNAQYLTGTYSKKGDAAKAAASSAVSAIGGILSAIFFGAGAFRIYGKDNAAEFVLTDDGFYAGKPDKETFVIERMTFIPNGQISATVTVKKNNVIMKNDYTGEIFNFNTKNSGIPSQQFGERLNAFLHPAKVESAAVPEEPFGEIKAEQGAEQAEKQLSPDDPFAD